MNRTDAYQGERAGPIAFMASNGVAANLLMFGILAAGLVALGSLERTAWPVFPFNTIEVSVAYPGATPEEMEESVVVKIEEQVEALRDVKEVKCLAAAGTASVRVELKTGADMGEAMDDVKSAVGRIQSFPAAAERPQFREMDSRSSIVRLIIFGDIPERSLKELANQIEDELESLPDVSQAETNGTRNYEISIDVPLVRLRALGLTLDDVADAVRRSSLDLSAGSIDTRDAVVRVRTIGQNYDQFDFEDVVVLARNDGTIVRLGEIAEVRDGFRETDLIVRHEGQPAAFVEVYQAEGEKVMDMARAVREHTADVIVPSLPSGVGITIWNDESQIYSERADILVRNGAMGLMLVFIALALFLEIRLALWVVAGLVTSGIGALALMLAFDLAINTISLFSFVLAVGIIVDDAIVVAEYIHYERMRGTPGLVAAIRGARRIKKALIFAVLTSVVAFLPILLIPGGVGEVWFTLPVIITAMLLISLAESLLILPRHLSHLHGPDWVPANIVDRIFARTRQAVDLRLNRFVAGPLDRALRFATNSPSVVMAGAVGLLVVSLSLVPAGIVPTTLTEVVEGDFVTATLEMLDGTPSEQTYEMAMQLEQAGRRVIERLDEDRPDGAPSLLSGVSVTVGRRPRVEGGGLAPTPTQNPQAHIAAIEFKLLSAERRDISTTAITQAWREEVGILPHVRGIAFSGELIDFGAPVHAVLSHPDPARLGEIADSVVEGLRSVAGVFDVRSDHAPGVPEIQLELRPEVRTLGLTVEEMARQVRAAFFGVEALRMQRGQEEVRVYARLPHGERDAITDVEGYLIRTRSGEDVPIRQAATLSMGTSPTTIQRQDGQRVVTVTADVDQSVITGGEATAILADAVLAELAVSNPELSFTFGGEQQQQLESLDALYRGFVLAMLAIFTLLAIPLGSYGKPFIVMAVIPFGLIGVVLGHFILGIAMSAASFIGFFGLSGVVVNDALVMIDFIDQRRREGASAQRAIIDGAKGRFRPIILTSITTFLGFTPLILERAIQAQFLVPFAASLGIGVLITTAILIVLTPALMAVYLRVNSRRALAS